MLAQVVDRLARDVHTLERDVEQGGRMQELDVVQGVHNLEQARDGMEQAHGKLAQDGMVLAHGAVLGRDVEHDVVQEQDVAHTDLYGNEFNQSNWQKNFFK